MFNIQTLKRLYPQFHSQGMLVIRHTMGRASDNNTESQLMSNIPIRREILTIIELLQLTHTGTSLVAQWLRIRLPMQGTRVRALVQEDPTCHGATKPMHHNYWACALGPASHNSRAHVPQLLKPARLEPVLRNKRSHCNEKPAHHNQE